MQSESNIAILKRQRRKRWINNPPYSTSIQIQEAEEEWYNDLLKNIPPKLARAPVQETPAYTSVATAQTSISEKRFNNFYEQWTTRQVATQEQMDRMESHLLRILKRLDTSSGDNSEQVVPRLPSPPEKSCLKPPTKFSVLPKVGALPVVASKARATAN